MKIDHVRHSSSARNAQRRCGVSRSSPGRSEDLVPVLAANNSPLRSRAMAPSQEETPGSISVSRASGRASRATAELAEPLRRGNAKGSHLRFADHRITSFRRRGQDNGEVPGRASKAMDGRPARRLARDHPTGS